MRSFNLPSLAFLWLAATRAVTADVVYVTDLSIFTVLAPCAASAISYVVQEQTYSNCPQAVTALQSCVCSKDNNFAAISSSLSKSVSYSCGSTASDDLASATVVLNNYCNQATITPFPSPSITVTQYVTDLAPWSNLAPCAASGVSEVVQGMTYSLCPSDPSLLAACICTKNQNSLLVSQKINTSVKYSCSSHTADIASAQAVFAAYCGLEAGTTSFPVTSNPPGDMSYYITALPQFSSLAPCAASAVSEGVFDARDYLCPGGPQALASCVCIKDQMSTYVSNVIVSSVKWSCSSTATADISSAGAVFDYYCSAAKAQVTAGGVTQSIAQSTASAGSGPAHSGATATGTGGTSTATSGGSSSGSGSGNSTGSGNNSTAPTTSSSPSIGAIVGGIVAAVAVVAVIAFLVWFFWRRSQRAKQQQAGGMAQNQDMGYGGNFNGPPGSAHGKAELETTTAVVSPVSVSPDMLKVNSPPRTDNISPVSANHSAYTPPPNAAELHSQTVPPLPQHSELHGQTSPYAAYPHQSELQGQNAYAPPPPRQPELAGSDQYPQRPTTSELQGNTGYAHHSPAQEAYSQQLYEAPGQGRPAEAGGHPVQRPPQASGFSAGPVSQYYEMDSGYSGAHAR